MNKRKVFNSIIAIILVILLTSFFTACSNTQTQEDKKNDPLTIFKSEVLDQDPDIINSEIALNGNVVECTIEIKDAATNDFANEIGKDHAEQLAKRVPGMNVRLKVKKDGNIIGDFRAAK